MHPKRPPVCLAWINKNRPNHASRLTMKHQTSLYIITNSTFPPFKYLSLVLFEFISDYGREGLAQIYLCY